MSNDALAAPRTWRDASKPSGGANRGLLADAVAGRAYNFGHKSLRGASRKGNPSLAETKSDAADCSTMKEAGGVVSREDHHQRRLLRLVERLPGRFREWTRWLLRPESRWARIPAAILLILGGFLGMLPVLGFWMLPLGVLLIAEDLPFVRRGVARLLEWVEHRRPHWFS